MLETCYRKSLLSMKAVWFAEKRNEDFEKECDIVYYHYLLNRPSGSFSEKKTLWSDLTKTKEDIVALADKSVRYEIRRAQNDGVETNFYDSYDLSNAPHLIESFSSAYNHFMKSKNLKGKFNHQAVNAYIGSGAFFVSTASHEENNYVFHSYIGDGEIARLLYSVSLFRDENDATMKALVGRANRLLHMNDMLLFKELGYSCYDWGGYSDAEDQRNIARFKKGFGGNSVTVYDALIPCSLVGTWVLKTRAKLSDLHSCFQSR